MRNILIAIVALVAIATGVTIGSHYSVSRISAVAEMTGKVATASGGFVNFKK